MLFLFKATIILIKVRIDVIFTVAVSFKLKLFPENLSRVLLGNLAQLGESLLHLTSSEGSSDHHQVKEKLS